MARHRSSLAISIFLIVVALLLFLLIQRAETAQPLKVYFPIISVAEQVKPIGPDGGHIVAIAVDPLNSKKVYAGTWGSGIYKSIDGASSWQMINDGLGNLYIYCLAIDPRAPDTLYAGTYQDGVYKSVNGGQTWFQTGPGLNTRAIVYALAIDPSNPQILYAGTRSPGTVPPYGGGVYKSTDAGSHWQVKNNGLGEDWIYSLTINPVTPTTLYAATHSAGVYKSINGAASWSAANKGISDQSTRTLVIDPQQTSTLYVGTWHGAGVYKTTDAGASWHPANHGLASAKIFALGINPLRPQSLFAATLFTGVYRSLDGGGTWTYAGLGKDFVYAVVPDPTSLSILYAGTEGDGFFLSTDTGGTWQRANKNLRATSVTAWAIDSNADTLYAGVYGGGVYKSAQQGQSWQQANFGLTDLHVHALVMAPDNPLILYAGTQQGGMVKTTDGGLSWYASNQGLPLMLSTFAKSISSSQDLSVPKPLDEDEFLMPGMESYSKELSLTSLVNPAVLAIAMPESDPNVLYIGTEAQGVYMSADRGATWRSTGLEGKTIFSLAVDPNQPSRLLAGTSADQGSLLISADGGSNWVFMNKGLEGRNVYALSLNLLASDEVLAGTDSGVYRSLNRGYLWTPLGLSTHKVVSLLVHPAFPQVILAGTTNGYFFTRDGGVTWQAKNDGLVNPIVQSLAVDTIHARTYLGTGGSSGYRWNTDFK